MVSKGGTLLGQMLCNERLDRGKRKSMVVIVTQRLFLYLSALLFVLLPLEATYAADGCASMATTSAADGDCDGCMEDEQQQCVSYCRVLCQTLLAEYNPSPVVRPLSALAHQRFMTKFPPFSNGGPEPPPPRMLR
jgi:hypothetical protein